MKKYALVFGLALSLLFTESWSAEAVKAAPNLKEKMDLLGLSGMNILDFYPEQVEMAGEESLKGILSAADSSQIDAQINATNHLTSEILDNLSKIEQAIKQAIQNTEDDPFDRSVNPRALSPVLHDWYQLKGTITSSNVHLNRLAKILKLKLTSGADTSTNLDEQIRDAKDTLEKIFERQKALVKELFSAQTYALYEPAITRMQKELVAQDLERKQYAEKVGEAAYRRTHGTREQRESVCPDHLVLGYSTHKVISDFTPKLFDAFNQTDLRTGEREPMATTRLNGKLWKIFALEKTSGFPPTEYLVSYVIAARMSTNVQDPKVKQYYLKHIDESRSGIIWRKLNDRSDDLGGSVCVYQSTIGDNSSRQQIGHSYLPPHPHLHPISYLTRGTNYTFAIVPAEEGDRPIVRQDTIARQVHHARYMHQMRQQGLDPHIASFKNTPNFSKDTPADYNEKVKAAQENTMGEMKERIARLRVHNLRGGIMDRESHEQIHASRVHAAGKMLHTPSTRLSEKERDFYGSDGFVDQLPTGQQVHNFRDAQAAAGASPVVANQTMTQAVNQRVAAALATRGEYRKRTHEMPRVDDVDAVYQPGASSKYERRVHGKMEKGATVYGVGRK